MKRVSRKWLINLGKLKSKKSNHSITIQFHSKSKLNKFKKKMSYYKKYMLSSTGYYLRVNVHKL